MAFRSRCHAAESYRLPWLPFVAQRVVLRCFLCCFVCAGHQPDPLTSSGQRIVRHGRNGARGMRLFWLAGSLRPFLHGCYPSEDTLSNVLAPPNLYVDLCRHGPLQQKARLAPITSDHMPAKGAELV